MKTTVKTHDKKLVVQPSRVAGLIELNVQGDLGHLTGTVLTPDQAGALIFGLEQALEANETAAKAPKAQSVEAIAEKCKHGIKRERRCFACDEREVHA